MSPDGLLVVDKAPGMTSHDVVARVRRLAGTRKVGHAGTLDPMATGVLLLGLGRATRLLGHLALAEKTYEATIRLGVATTTDDAEGEVLDRAPVDSVGEAEVRAALAAMVGEVDQVPSAVSAVKVAGRRSYERVRAGEQVELAARRVVIHQIEVHRVLGVDHAAGSVVDVEVTVRCSSGTYVRAIARDLGTELGVGGHLTALRRTAIGAGERSVSLADAHPLDALQGADPLPVIGMGEAARRFFDWVEVSADDAVRVGHGKRLTLGLPASRTAPTAVVGPDGALLGLYAAAEPRDDGDAKPMAVFS